MADRDMSAEIITLGQSHGPDLIEDGKCDDIRRLQTKSTNSKRVDEDDPTESALP